MFSEDRGMQFEIQKCALVEMKRGRIVSCEGIDLPKGETIKSAEEEVRYKYVGILQCNVVKSAGMKNLLRREYLRIMRKILKTKLNAGNTIEAINSRAISVIRYGTGIIDWRKNKLRQMDKKTRGRCSQSTKAYTREMM